MIYQLPITLLSAVALALAPAATNPAEQQALEQLGKTAIVTPAGHVCGTTEGFKTQAELRELCGVTASVIWQGNPENPESIEIELHDAPEETPAETPVASVEAPVAAVYTPAAPKPASRTTAPEKTPEVPLEAPQKLLLPAQAPKLPAPPVEAPVETPVGPEEATVEAALEETPAEIQAVQEYETVELYGYSFTFTADTHQLVNPPGLGVPEAAPAPEPGKPSIGTAVTTEIIHGYAFTFEGINTWTLTKITPPQ